MSYTTFKGVVDWREDSYIANLSYGFKAWARWAMLQVGGFENVTKAQSGGLYGGHPSILRPVKDPRYTDGQVWEGIRTDWVWETGVAYTTTPKVCTGVYVNDGFKPTATEVGTYAHYIDFPRGRIVFNSAIATTADVRCDYSFRIPTINDSKEPWMQELMYGTLNMERSDFLIAASGSHSQLSEARRQMPTVGIGLTTRGPYSPYQIGGGQWVNQNLGIHILAENEADRDNLVDIFANQNDKVIWLPNRKLMKESAQFPVDVDLKGRPVTNPMTYPQIVSATGDGGFQWARIMLRNAQGQLLQSINDWLYRGTVRITAEAIFENI